MFRCLWVFACLSLLGLGGVWDGAWAAHPGFRTIGIWNAEDKIRLDLCVWYPVRRPASAARYGDWLLTVNRRAAPLPGSFPLVVISHGSPGNRFAHHDLAAALASRGFVVVAPTHQDDHTYAMRHLFMPRQLTRRLEELRHTIDKILADPEIGPIIDANRIGLIGFGSGGATALLAAGGRISPEAWEEWKAKAPPDAPYLYPRTRSRLDLLAGDPALRQVQADNRLRCVIAATPAYSMFFSAASLARIRVPVLLIATERDPVNPPPGRLDALRAMLPVPPDTALIPTADPLALMALPETRQAAALPGYATPGVKRRQAIFEHLDQAVSGFFLRTIGNPNLPPPPPPLPDDTVRPDENPRPEPSPEPPKGGKTKKGRR